MSPAKPFSDLLAPATAPHQSRLAFAASLRRVGDYGRRAALTRLLLLAMAAATMVVVSAPWGAWLVIGVAALGSYLSWATNNTIVTQRPPLEPLARWSSEVTDNGLGRFRPDVSGILEGVSYIPLACLGPWMLSEETTAVRILLLAIAMAWIASCVCAIFLDPAFYRPEGVPRYAALGRRVVGPAAGVLAVLVVAPAPWSVEGRTLALLVASSLALTQLRIRETDRLLTSADEFVDVERVDARKDLIVHAHNLIGGTVTALGTRLESLRAEEDLSGIWDLYRDVRVGYSTLLAFDIAGDVDIEWPGLLAADLQRIRGRTGMHVQLHIPADRLAPQDRRIAYYLLDDFATNAANSGAESCHLRMWREDSLWRVTAHDDGDPINPSAWLREGGDLSRMMLVLRRTGAGDIRASAPTDPKMVEAYWTAAAKDVSQ